MCSKTKNKSKSSYEHLGKRKIIFKNILVGDMLVPRRVSKKERQSQKECGRIKTWQYPKLEGCFALKFGKANLSQLFDLP